MEVVPTRMPAVRPPWWRCAPASYLHRAAPGVSGAVGPPAAQSPRLGGPGQPPARLHTGRARRTPAIKSSSGAVEKSIEVEIRHGFEHRGRGGNPIRTNGLSQLEQLPARLHSGSDAWNCGRTSFSSPTHLDPPQL